KGKAEPGASRSPALAESSPNFFKPGPQGEQQAPARVGSVTIVGNDITRESSVRRQVPSYPGQELTYPGVRQSEGQKIASKDREGKEAIAKTKTDQGRKPSDASHPVLEDTLVDPKKTTTGSLMFGVGVNSDSGLFGSIALSNGRNTSGKPNSPGQ